MTSFILGRNFPNRMDLLIEVAKVFDRLLDLLDSGRADSVDFVLSRAGSDVRVTLSKERRQSQISEGPSR